MDDILIGERIGRHYKRGRRIFRRGLICYRIHDRRRLVHIRYGEREHIGCTQVSCIRRRHTQVQTADLRIVRCAGQCARRCIEDQPGWQCHAIGQRSAIGHQISGIRITKGLRRHLNAERRSLKHRLVGKRNHHRRSLVRGKEVGKIEDAGVRERKDLHHQGAVRPSRIEMSQSQLI